MRAMAANGRIGDEMYLTQFAFEEAQHTEVFRRWMDAVGLTEDLHPYVADNPGYRKIFYEELPAVAAGAGATTTARSTQIRASVTYNHVVEGTPRADRLLRVEARCARSTASCRACRSWSAASATTSAGTWRGAPSPAAATSPRTTRNWDVVTQRMGELLPHALNMIQWVHDQFEERRSTSTRRSSSATRRTARSAAWARSSRRAACRGADRPGLLAGAAGGHVRRRGREGDRGSRGRRFLTCFAVKGTLRAYLSLRVPFTAFSSPLPAKDDHRASLRETCEGPTPERAARFRRVSSRPRLPGRAT